MSKFDKTAREIADAWLDTANLNGPRLESRISAALKAAVAEEREASHQAAIQIALNVHWGLCAPTEAPYNRGLNSGATQMRQAIATALVDTFHVIRYRSKGDE